MSLRAALALCLLALAAAPARAARALTAATEPLSDLLPNCQGSLIPKGIYQIKARSTYDCGRTVDDVTRPGGQDYVVFFGGSPGQCLKNAPLARPMGTFNMKRSLWDLDFDATTRSGTVRAHERGCGAAGKTWLSMTSSGKPTLSAKPVTWKIERSAAAVETEFCDDYKLVHPSGRVIELVGDLTCAREAPFVTLTTNKPGTPSKESQQFVFASIFPQNVNGI